MLVYVTSNLTVTTSSGVGVTLTSGLVNSSVGSIVGKVWVGVYSFVLHEPNPTTKNMPKNIINNYDGSIIAFSKDNYTTFRVTFKQKGH